MYKHMEVSKLRAYVTKWGNSLGVRIPASMAEEVQIENGTPVEIEVRDEMIVIRRQKFNLKELLAQITPENVHEEVSPGDPVGKEAW